MNLIFTLVCLTIDRYLAVVKSLQHRTIMTRRTAYRMLVVVYFLSFLLAVIPILTNARYKYHPGTNHCSPSWSNSCAYGAALTTIAFILPIVGMLVTYTRIFLTLKRKRVHMSKSSTSTMSSKDTQDEDSNSLGNLEDTSTDPSGDDDIRLTAHKILVDAKNANLKYDLQPGASLENLVQKDSTIQQTTAELTARKTTGRSKQKFVKNIVGVCSSSNHLEEKDLTTKHTTAKPIDCKMFEDSKENIVDNGLEIGSSSKQLQTSSPDGHFPKVDSTVNDTEDKGLGDDSVTTVGTHLENQGASNMHDANKTGITCMDMIGTDQKSLGLQAREKDDAGTSLSNLSVDGAVNNFSLNMADKKPDSRHMAGIDKAYSVPECSVKEAVIPGINPQGKVSLELPTTSTDNNSDVFDRKGTQTANNKQVSFQNPTNVSPSKTEEKEEGKRSSSVFPVSRSRKAINVLVNRMKKQRAIRHEYKIARTGTILLVSFLVLWMPYVIAHLCFVGNCRTMTLYNVATFLVYTNALANPIIYALTNRAVMQDIRKSMGRLCASR